MSSTVEPMSCETTLDLVDSLLDDELDASVARELNRHLAACSNCSREVTSARQILSELRSLPEFDPPPRVVEHVQQIVDREAHRHGAFAGRRWQRWIAVAAALVLAVGAGTVSRHRTAAADAEARRAAAELTYALACVSNITQRANRAVRSEVIDHRVIPVAARGLGRPFQQLSNGISRGTSPVTPPGIRNEGNS